MLMVDVGIMWMGMHHPSETLPMSMKLVNWVVGEMKALITAGNRGYGNYRELMR